MDAMLTRYEMTRVVSILALQISQGQYVPKVKVTNEKLMCDSVYIASLEILNGLADIQVRRGSSYINVKDTICRDELRWYVENVSLELKS